MIKSLIKKAILFDSNGFFFLCVVYDEHAQTYKQQCDNALDTKFLCALVEDYHGEGDTENGVEEGENGDA